MENLFDRRRFLQQATILGGLTTCRTVWPAQKEPVPDRPEPHPPLGKGQGIYPGRVVWVHDPKVTDWQGPGDGHWWQPGRIKQDRLNAMLARCVMELAGQTHLAKAWDQIFRHFNRTHGRGDVGYRTGEKIVIKPNWVGLIWRDRNVDPETYRLVRRQDYMNTSPQILIALLTQLVKEVGVRPADITVCDTLALLADEFYQILHEAFPEVRYEDHGGKPGRIKVKVSDVPLYWSCRPQGGTPDYVPACFAEAAYVINLANLKGHTAAGVTLCGKNHFGSLVRWPVQQGYYDMHRGSFTPQRKAYREQVDLLGHAHLGGKTVLNMLDGIFTGKHYIDPSPRRWKAPPFNDFWPCSLFVSQDAVALDSVGFDFIWDAWEDCARMPRGEDYLHEAALAHQPPSGTFYDPNHPTPTQRLESLGVHEHWNNPEERKYSRNLGRAEGIELIAARLD